MADRGSSEGTFPNQESDNRGNPPGDRSRNVFNPARQREISRRTLVAEFNRLNPQYNEYGQRARELGQLAALHEYYFSEEDVGQQRQVREQFSRLAADFRQNYLVTTQYANNLREYNRQATGLNPSLAQNDRLMPLPNHVDIMNRAYNDQVMLNQGDEEGIVAFVATNDDDWNVVDLRDLNVG